MKRRVGSILLAVIMIMNMTGFWAVTAFAEDTEYSEEIIFGGTNEVSGEHFILKTTKNDSDGWYASDDNPLTVTAKDESVLITRIEAEISGYGYNNLNLIVNPGEKQETRKMNSGETLHIDNINSFSVKFTSSNKVQFNKITVYYEYHEHTWSDTMSSDVTGHWLLCDICGTKKDFSEHIGIEDGVCDICGYGGEFKEVIKFKRALNASSEHFSLKTGIADSDGWYATDGCPLTITAEDGFIITRIEAVIGWLGGDYRYLTVSPGQKKETAGVSNGSTVHFEGIDSASVTVAGKYTVQLKDITVYYKLAANNQGEGVSSTISNGDLWIIVAVAGIGIVVFGIAAARSKKH